MISRELTYPTWEKENYLQNAFKRGYVSSQEGNFSGVIFNFEGLTVTKSLSRCFCFSSLLLALRSCTVWTTWHDVLQHPYHQLSCFMRFDPNKPHTVDGRNHHLGCIKPCKSWDIYHINWLAGFLQSTVWKSAVSSQQPPQLLLENCHEANSSSLRSFCRRSSSIRSLSAAVDTSQQRPEGWWLGGVSSPLRLRGVWFLNLRVRYAHGYSFITSNKYQIFKGWGISQFQPTPVNNEEESRGPCDSLDPNMVGREAWGSHSKLI